jgi:hypothetical protein
MVGRKTTEIDMYVDRKKRCLASSGHTANEGPVRIQYKCLIPIYIFPEMKLRSFFYFQNRIIMLCLPISTNRIFGTVQAQKQAGRRTSTYCTVSRQTEIE